MNLNQINNQQSDATAALVEKLINAIDAVLLAKCYEAGIDPKGPEAPVTMGAAVQDLFKVKDGRLENLSAQQQGKLADAIQFVATGSKKEPCYLVIDKGEGQTATSFPDTFLSLTKQNKDDIPFVQGRSTAEEPAYSPSAVNASTSLLFPGAIPAVPFRRQAEIKASGLSL